MKVVIDTGKTPNNSLVENYDSFKPIEPPAIVYGDKVRLEIYPMLSLSVLNEWAGTATLKVAVGNHATGEIFLPAQVCTWTGDYYETIIDLSGSAFEELTRDIIETEVELEIQVSGMGFTQTIYQKEYKLRNQLIGAEQVVIDKPDAPSDIEVVDLGLPNRIYDLEVIAPPVAPSNVQVGSNELVLPLAPSDVNAEQIEGKPLAPSDVVAKKEGVAEPIDWIIVGVLPEAPSDIVPTLLSPFAPSDIEVVNLFNIVPQPAIAGDIETIPLEPSEFELLTNPIAPSEVALDISPTEVDEVQAWDYASRPAGLFGGEPSNLRVIELFIAGDHSPTDRGNVPSEVSAVDYNNRLPAHPYQAVLEVEALSNPIAPSNVQANLTSLGSITVLPKNAMEPEVKLNSGQVLSAGTYFRTYYDSSGSMNAIIPAVRIGISNLRTYLSTVLYDNASEAQTYISPATAFGNEQWILRAMGGGSIYQKEINVIFINESQSQYHSNGTIVRSTALNHRNTYIGYYNSKLGTSTHHAYIIGYLWSSGSWKPVTEEFEKHLDQMIYKDASNPLANYGIKGYMDWDSNAGSDASVQFLVNYLNIPQIPSQIDMTVNTRNANQYSNQWQFTTDTTIKGKAGTYSGSSANKVSYTQDRWEADISYDGSTVVDTIDYGASIPSHIVLSDTDYPVSVIHIRIRAVGLSGHADKESAWVSNGRIPANISELDVTQS